MKNYKCGKIKSHLDGLQGKTNECTALILDTIEKYVRPMSNKLTDPLIATKTYWSILNLFLNNRKIPAIPPPLVNGDIITNFSRKLTFITSFCRPIYSL